MDRCNNNFGKGGGRFKLFGVDINLQDELYDTSSSSSDSILKKKKKRIHMGEDVDCMSKSKSMGNLHEFCYGEEQHHGNGIAHDDPGYHSDDLLHLNSGRSARIRKKGIPWTPSEHRSFLIGLEKLGKGDWKGISKNYVPTRTPTQVASHAQKYFLRITAADKKNRRASLFDIPFKESNPPPHASTAASFNALERSPQDGLSAHIAASEKKPPLSPATRTYASDACHISYIAGVRGQRFPASHIMPQTELYPMPNYPYPSSYYDSSSHANFPAHGLFLQPHTITQGTSQARQATTVAENSATFMNQYQTVKGPETSTVAKKHGLEASIGALSL